MDSGINNDIFPLTIRNLINLLSAKYKLNQVKASSVVYALLEAGALAEEMYSLRFLETLVNVTIPINNLESLIDQIINGSDKEAIKSTPAPLLEVDGNLQVTATIPMGISSDALMEVENMRTTFNRIIDSAESALCVSSPYIEQSGLSLLLNSFEKAAKRGARLRLLTRIDDRNNPDMRKITALLTLFECFKTNIEIRSFSKTIGSNQYRLSLGGVHAKILIADNIHSYIGSGEVRDHALNHNFELGIVINDKKISAVISQLFDTVWNISDDVALEYCQSFIK